MKRKIVALILCLCLLLQFNICSIVSVFAEEEQQSGIETVAETVEADYAANPDKLDCIKELSRYENNEVLVLYTDGQIKVHSYENQEKLAVGLQEFEADCLIEYYQPNFRYQSDSVKLRVTDDTYLAAQWYLINNGKFKGAVFPLKAVRDIDINAGTAWDAYEAKRSVVVAVVDTGIDRYERDLNGRIWCNKGEIQGNWRDDDGNGFVDDYWGWNFYGNNNVMYSSYGDEDDHGTHCASVIASHADNGYGIAGIAPYENIKIMSVKALGGKEGNGTTEAVVRAIEYAEDNGAKICNLSIGCEVDDFIMKKTILGSKMLFVAAAGNSTGAAKKGNNLDYHATYPAGYHFGNVITVANIAADGRLHASSDYGYKSVDIAAPGTDIAGATVNEGFVYMTGTSMAAPMVAATAALVYTASDDMTAAEVKDCILNNAKHLDSLTGYVGTEAMLDAGAAVKYTVEQQKQKDNPAPENGGSSVSGADADTGGSQAENGSQNAGDAGNNSDKGHNSIDSMEKKSVSVTIPIIEKTVEIKVPAVLGNILERFIKIGRR